MVSVVKLCSVLWIHVILFVRCCQVIIQSVITQCVFPLPFGIFPFHSNVRL